MKTIFAIVMAIVVTAPDARAATITFQAALSEVTSEGTTQVQQGVSAEDGYASSQAIWPAGLATEQARTAARSSITEIAANALVFSNTFSALPIDLALSQAFYAIDLQVGPVPHPTALEFFLPPSYVEIGTNAELQFNVMEAVFLADLSICQTASCTSSDTRFFFQVDGSGSFREFNYSINVFGDPSLDLSPLQNPTVSQTDGFLRTYLVEFPAFTGYLDLSNLVNDQPIRVEYTLQARASGRATLSSAIAAINDPFVLDTDPVRQGAPITLIAGPTTDVPEPGSFMLMGLALGSSWLARRRTRLRHAMSVRAGERGRCSGAW